MCMFVAVALTLTQGPVLRKNTASVISVSLKTLFRGTESYPGAALDEDHRLYWSVREYAMTVGVYTLWPVASLRYHIRYDRRRLFVFVIKYAMTGGVSSLSHTLWPVASLCLRYQICYDRWRLFVFVMKYAMTVGVFCFSSLPCGAGSN